MSEPSTDGLRTNTLPKHPAKYSLSHGSHDDLGSTQSFPMGSIPVRGVPSFVSAVGDQKSQADGPFAQSCQRATRLSVESPPETLLEEAERSNLLPPYRGKLRHSRSHSQGQALCAPVLTIPSPKPSLPSFSSVLSSLGIESDKPLQSPSENAARQGCATPNGAKADWIAWSDSAGQPSPSDNSSIAAGTSGSNRPNGPSLRSTETGATAIDARSPSMTQGGFLETETTFCPIGPEDLKIEWRLRSRDSYPTCSVQLQNGAGEPTSKASQIQIYTTESPASIGPRLYVRVYHDPANPYYFSSSSGARALWLECKLQCSKIIVKGLEQAFTPTLASSLRSSSPHYEAKLKKWGLGQRDKEVLDFALNKVGEGDPHGPLQNQPWKHFLECCIEWDKSKGWRDHKAVEAKRKKSTYRRG